MKLYNVVFMALATSHCVFAEPSELLEYKCHLETTLGDDISFHRWESLRYVEELAQLTASKLETSHGIAYVKDVVQCVQLEQDFSRADSIILDKKTVR